MKTKKSDFFLFLTVSAAFLFLLPLFSSCDTGGNFPDENLGNADTEDDSTMSISSYEDLTAFRFRVENGESDLNAELQADIEIPAGTDWKPIGRIKTKKTYSTGKDSGDTSQDTSRDNGFDWSGSLPYKGTFEGNGYTISGVNITANSEESVGAGFFAAVAWDGAVKNLKLVCTLDLKESVLCAGAIAGCLASARIEACEVTITVNAPESQIYALGCVVGTASDSAEISGCSATILKAPEFQKCAYHYGVICGNFNSDVFVTDCKFRTSEEREFSQEPDIRDGYHRIYHYEDLLAFAQKVNGGETNRNAILMADIEIPDGTNWTPIGYLKGEISADSAWLEDGSLDWQKEDETDKPFSIDWEGCRDYCGIFNGNGYTISGMDIVTNPSESVSAGFFAAVGSKGSVVDLTVKGKITVSGYMLRVGGIAGYLQNGGMVMGCESVLELAVSPGSRLHDFGGIAGTVESGSFIKSCSVTILNGPALDYDATQSSGLLSHVKWRGHIAGLLQNGACSVVDCRYRNGTSEETWQNLSDVATNTEAFPAKASENADGENWEPHE